MEICNIAPKFNQVTYKILSFYCIFYLCFSRTMVLCIKRLRFFCCSNIFFLFFYLLFSFFFFIYFYWLEANYFTTLQWVLSYIDMNQPWSYMHSPSRSPSHLPLPPIPLGLPSAPGPSTCLMHPIWAGDLFHPR